jgi:dihydroneopterin aldolase
MIDYQRLAEVFREYRDSFEGELPIAIIETTAKKVADELEAQDPYFGKVMFLKDCGL